MDGLLTDEELPHGFRYPPQFLRVVHADLTDPEPWHLLSGNRLRTRFAGLRDRFPERNLLPFARRQDNDDVACFVPSSDAAVHVIHDFASSGWERRATFVSFDDWFRQAIEDFLNFE